MRGVKGTSDKYCKKHPEVEKTRWISRPKRSSGGTWECPVCNAERLQRVNIEFRSDAFTALGGKCSRCGESDWCVLQIDHVNGDGAEERRVLGLGPRSVGSGLNLRRVRDWFYAHLDRYQLLCANCHVRKGKENDDQYKSQRKWTAPGKCAFMEVTHAS